LKGLLKQCYTELVYVVLMKSANKFECIKYRKSSIYVV